MGAIILAPKSDCSHPLIDEPSVLARAEVAIAFGAARKCKIVKRAAAALQPSQKASASRLKQFELDGSPCLLLNDHSACSDTTAGHEIADAYLHQITSSKFAIDREVEESPVPQATLSIKPKSNSPNLLRLQRALRTQLVACIPSGAVLLPRIIDRVSHVASPRPPSAVEKNLCPQRTWSGRWENVTFRRHVQKPASESLLGCETLRRVRSCSRTVNGAPFEGTSRDD